MALNESSPALKRLEAVLRDKPGSGAAVRWAARLELARGNHEAALRLLRRNLQEPEAEPWQRFMLGWVAHTAGNPHEAVAEWTKLRNSQQVLNALADQTVAEGDLEKALIYHRAAVRLHPHSANARLKLAEALFKSGAGTEALEHYQKGFQLGEVTAVNLGEAAYHQGEILREQGRYQEAITSFKTALKFHPNYAWYLVGLGKAYASMGDSGAAERWFQETIRVAPSLAFSYAEFGSYYRSRGDLKKAIEKYEQAIRVQPECPGYYYENLGSLYLDTEKYDAAVQALEQAVRIDPDQPYYKQRLAEAQAAAAR
ncbi:MAG: tetratricopeptide repeat protein [Acidobacteria bacterium]|nr:tetratricopeptide repeat protein [Acidobacteriota bacterium]